MWYMHAAMGFSFNSTWLRAIKAVNFETWPGINYSNASTYCPHAVETLKGHMLQYPQGVSSTKKKCAAFGTKDRPENAEAGRYSTSHKN